ncbi:MAG: TatD family hydrolase [Dehalococcoidia bacterium]
MRLFDSHAHLQDRAFERDCAEVIERARDAGVGGVVVLGTDVVTSEEAIAMAEANAVVHAAAGCHPHDARSMNEPSLERLAELAQYPRVVAVGEIGLDFYRNLSQHDQQIEVFRRQLDTAAEVGKPVAVHCRDADDTMLPLLESWSRRMGGRLPDGRPLGVMHYFAGDVALAERCIDLGFLISIHTSVTYPSAHVRQDVARSISLDSMLVETDSPYGAPQSRREGAKGQRPRGEPADVAEAVAKIAELRGETPETVAEATTTNALRLFGIEEASVVAGGGASRRAAERSA